MSEKNQMTDYGTAIRDAFAYLLKKYPEVFVIGQGLWSPWYVGNSMTKLDQEFGIDRIIDTPVSESACTGAAVGAALAGMKPIVVHPRMDFMLYAIDSVVNEAAKWSSMMGGQAHAGVTIRAIINRGGEQGAQHSQALHAWFAHVPGLRVVMPSTVSDARDLLIASVLSGDPVMYIDDRWLYSLEENLGPVKELDLHSQGPKVVRSGTDVTLAAAGYSTKMCLDAAAELQKQGVSAEVIDIRVLNPFSPELIAESVRKTGRLVAVDGGWETAGFAGEVIASVVERVNPELLKMSPKRVTLPASPAPSSRALEDIYYPKTDDLVRLVIANLKS
jgi:pyruvate dehydrogenase E1 component beta subunit